MLLCVGAADRATICRRVSVGQDSAETFTMDPGREARGCCLVGRQPVAQAEARLTFAGLRSQRPYAIPLDRREEKIVDSAKTDSEGRFTFGHIAAGSHVIDVSLPNGRITRSAVITIAPRKSNEAAALTLSDIFLPPGIDVVVRVRSRSGIPVANAEIRTFQEADAHDGMPIQLRATSDHEGNAALSGADPNLALSLSCTAEGFLRENVSFDAPPRKATCMLTRYSSLGGEVRDDKGTIRAGAIVSISGASRPATTGADGAFVFRNLGAGEFDLRVTLPGFRTLNGTVSVASEEDKQLGAIELVPGDTVNGQVRDAESGLPVPNAHVRIIDPAGSGETTSDDSGSFSFTADATAAMSIEVSATGYATVQQTRIASPPDSDLLIDLPRPGRLEVAVLDRQSNAACSGCKVIAVRMSAARSAITGAGGVAVFDDATPGVYRVTLEIVRASSAGTYVSSGGQWLSAFVKPRETTRLRIEAPE